MARRLDYLEWLGVDALWLCPIYRSPMRDFGYDISDFCSVDPLYGTLDDFDRLLDALHKRGIRLILDFVPNHTSDIHPWFTESRASRDNPRRDWYVWADPGPDGGPPNNWLSRFGGSAWQWDEPRRQYYYHAFLLEQPDLNWRNPTVRAAMSDVMRFWMRRGVDGFRVDASAVLAKDELLRDDPPDQEAGPRTPPPQRLKRIFTDDRPETMAYIEAMRAVVEEFPERILCGEVQGKIDRIGHFYDGDKQRLHLPLNFALLDTPWNALALQAAIDAYFNAIPQKAWPDWVIGGHDKQRVASRIGEAQARVLAVLLLTLKGTPFFFAGDEIGMERVAIPPERVNDPFGKLVEGYDLGRDPERAPIAWNGGRNGGFTQGEPWLPLGADVARRNVEAMMADRRSLLWLYRRLIRLRREQPVLTAGEFVPMRSRNDILRYRRVCGAEAILVALNLVHEPRKLEWRGTGERLISTALDGEGERISGPLLLRPDEGIVIRIQS